MEKIDPKKARQVWQRVQAPAAPSRDTQALLALQRAAVESAALCRHLSRVLPERLRPQLREMEARERQQAACLRGIYVLLAGQKPPLSPFPPQAEPPEVILRRCYGNALRTLSEYENWLADPQFSQVFAQLAQQKREHCRALLVLLGELP